MQDPPVRQHVHVFRRPWGDQTNLQSRRDGWRRSGAAQPVDRRHRFLRGRIPEYFQSKCTDDCVLLLQGWAQSWWESEYSCSSSTHPLMLSRVFKCKFKWYMLSSSLSLFFVFQPPPQLALPNFKGCIELDTLNEDVLSLYNFEKIFKLNTTVEKPCGRWGLLSWNLSYTFTFLNIIGKRNSFLSSVWFDRIIFVSLLTELTLTFSISSS